MRGGTPRVSGGELPTVEIRRGPDTAQLETHVRLGGRSGCGCAAWKGCVVTGPPLIDAMSKDRLLGMCELPTVIRGRVVDPAQAARRCHHGACAWDRLLGGLGHTSPSWPSPTNGAATSTTMPSMPCTPKGSAGPSGWSTGGGGWRGTVLGGFAPGTVGSWSGSSMSPGTAGFMPSCWTPSWPEGAAGAASGPRSSGSPPKGAVPPDVTGCTSTSRSTCGRSISTPAVSGPRLPG